MVPTTVRPRSGDHSFVSQREARCSGPAVSGQEVALLGAAQVVASDASGLEIRMNLPCFRVKASGRRCGVVASSVSRLELVKRL